MWSLPFLVAGLFVVIQGQQVPGVPSTPTSSVVNDVTLRTATSSPTDLSTPVAWSGNGWQFESNGILQPTAANTAIQTKATYKNFELVLRCKAANERFGIQFLRTSFKDTRNVQRTVAYQLDVGEGAWGGLSDVGSRNRLIRIAPHSPIKSSSVNPQEASYAPWASQVVDVGDWNEMRLVVEYPRIRGWVNGILAVDFTETDFEIVSAVKSAISENIGQPIVFKAYGTSIQVDRPILTTLSDDEVPALGHSALATIGRWMAPTDLGIIGIHSHLLPNGKVLIFDSTLSNNNAPRLVTLYNPDSGQIEDGGGYFEQQKIIELFCSGHTPLPNGNLIFHGNTQNKVAASTWRASVLYDWKTNQWTRLPTDTNRAGYYPTVTQTISGDTMVFAAGTFVHGKQRRIGDHTEVFNYQTTEWRNLKNDAAWTALNENYLGSDGWTHRSFGKEQGLVEKFDVYYNIAMMPGSGKILHFGGSAHLAAADYNGDGGVEYYNKRDDIPRWYGLHQVYGNGRVLVAGGGSYSQRYGGTGGAWDGGEAAPNSAAIVDMNEDTATARATGEMQEGRQRATSTLMADGSVFVHGGHDLKVGTKYSDSAINNHAWNSAKLRPEIWNPQTGMWSEMSPAQRRRQYHACTLLLPDGRILATGSGYPRNWQHAISLNGYQPWDDYSIEIFEPPYLFDGAGNYAVRPEITWAPLSLGYQSAFTVNMKGGGAVSKLHLIKTSSQTHSVEMSARLVELSFQQSNRLLRVEGLEDSTIAPPGYYMLIAVDSKGVPSVAKMVKVDGFLSVHIVTEATGDALVKNGDGLAANEKVRTADFTIGDPKQAWLMHHGKWSGAGYRFLSRHHGMALDTRFVKGWDGRSVLNMQKPSVDADILPKQTFYLTQKEVGQYAIGFGDLALDAHFTKGFKGLHGTDEVILFPYQNGHAKRRFHLYPTNAPTTIRLVTGGGALTLNLQKLVAEGSNWYVEPAGNGMVNILSNPGGSRALSINGSSVMLATANANSEWEIKYLTMGRVQLIHVNTGLALGSQAVNLSSYGEAIAKTPDSSDVLQIWRLVN